MRTFVTLTCGHVSEYVARVFALGDERMCIRCNRVGRITQIDAQYRYQCKTCRSGRSYGMSKLTMEREADAHMRRSPSHTVQLLAGDAVIGIRAGKILQKPLDFPPY